MKPLACVAEDGWPQSTRSKRNVPTVPLGDREEMLHFQHHFTQDDLITLCKWTVPPMRTPQVCATPPPHEACHRRDITCYSVVSVLIIECNRKLGTTPVFMVSFQMISHRCTESGRAAFFIYTYIYNLCFLPFPKKNKKIETYFVCISLAGGIVFFFAEMNKKTLINME